MTPKELSLLFDELRRDEGFRRSIYPDSKGIPTVGVGHNCKASPLPAGWKCPLTDAQIDVLLNKDVQITLTALDLYLPWWKSLDAVRQRIVANMCFNMGIVKLMGFHNALAAMCSGDYIKAANEMRDSEWYGEVGSRAVRMCEAMKTGVMGATH